MGSSINLLIVVKQTDQLHYNNQFNHDIYHLKRTMAQKASLLHSYYKNDAGGWGFERQTVTDMHSVVTVIFSWKK